MLKFSERYQAGIEFDEWRLKQTPNMPTKAVMNVLAWLEGEGSHWLERFGLVWILRQDIITREQEIKAKDHYIELLRKQLKEAGIKPS